MSLAAFTRFLVEKGASPEVIEAVVDYVTRDSVTVTRDKRDNVRDLARERQRRRREKLAAQREIGAAKANDVADARNNVTRDKRDADLCDTNYIQEVRSIDEGREEKKVSKKEGSEIARARGTRMAAGAILTDPFRQAALDLGAQPEEIPEMWVEFVDYWVGVPGHRGCKLDWLATWRNDVRKKLKFRGKPNGHGPAGRRQSLSDLAFDLAEQARSAEREAGIIRSDDPIRGH